MTITLTWWMLPILLIAAGIAFTHRPRQRGGYINIDVTGGIVLLCCIISALSIVIGKFI